MRFATCHPERPYCSKGLCKRCYHLKYNKEYLRNPENKRKANARTVDWRKQRSPVGYERNVQLKYLYGISLQDYEQILAKQEGVCALCKNPPKSHIALSVDHNYKTGDIRGLLCAPCNWMVGVLDNEDWTEKAQIYRHKSSSGFVIPLEKLKRTNRRRGRFDKFNVTNECGSDA